MKDTACVECSYRCSRCGSSPASPVGALGLLLCCLACALFVALAWWAVLALVQGPL